tara:strand:+ start:302 stop:883 length:582 start_codon:yes stop_codon:yes gene_type:complete
LKKLIYIEENFISPDECKKLINLSLANKSKEVPYGDESRGGDTFLTTVDHNNPEQSLSKGVDWVNHGAAYYGGDVDPVKPPLDYDVISRVNTICKNFDSNANLDYVGVVRWPVGTFMKPHVDDNNVHNPDMFAAMLYLNDNFSGGHTCFENLEVKPEIGKLIIFSNAYYLHYVNEVKDAERFVLSFWYNSLDK